MTTSQDDLDALQMQDIQMLPSFLEDPKIPLEAKLTSLRLRAVALGLSEEEISEREARIRTAAVNR